MAVFVKQYNCIFVHIPKTAGTSIIKRIESLSPVTEVKNNLAKNDFYHSTYSHCKESIKDLQSYFKFTVVRNPWDRACSWFFYRKQRIEKNLNGVRRDMMKNKVELIKEYDFMNKDFNEWLDRYIEVEWDFTWFSLSHSQMTWIDRTENFDKICKFETLQSDLNEIGINIRHSNKSSNRNLLYRELFNLNSINLINRHYEEDIDLFKYGF